MRIWRLLPPMLRHSSQSRRALTRHLVLSHASKRDLNKGSPMVLIFPLNQILRSVGTPRNRPNRSKSSPDFWSRTPSTVPKTCGHPPRCPFARVLKEEPLGWSPSANSQTNKSIRLILSAARILNPTSVWRPCIFIQPRHRSKNRNCRPSGNPSTWVLKRNSRRSMSIRLSISPISRPRFRMILFPRWIKSN